MKNSPELNALLSDEVTRAALRADGVPLSHFVQTLEQAAERIARSRRAARDAAATPPVARKTSVFSFACCGA